MSLELLKKNIEREAQLIKEVFQYKDSQSSMVAELISKLIDEMKIINNSIPLLVENINFYKTISKKDPNIAQLVIINYKSDVENTTFSLAIRAKDEQDFIKLIRNKNEIYRRLNFLPKKSYSGSYLKFSNKYFRELATKYVEKEMFVNLKKDLKKISSPLMINSYVAMMFSFTALSFILGLILFVALLLFKVGFLISFLIFIIIPIIIFISFYYYPSSQRKSLEKEINQELPFLTIYMSAIATSGIEPFKIFSILAASADYPYTTREIKKLTNYINFYGYDLVSALRTVSKNCPSELLALLFDGLATTITSGGELNGFLQKHSETLLFDYRLEREKYTHVAETFMNIYISIVIAAPMILMMLFVLMSMTGFGGGILSPSNLSFLIIFVISFLNIGFLLFLNTKQPKF